MMGAHYSFLPEIFHCEYDDESVQIIMGEYKVIEKEKLSAGDFHAENILRDEKSDQLLLCDWQSVSLNHPASDIAFFMSRLQGDEISFEENKITDTARSD